MQPNTHRPTRRPLTPQPSKRPRSPETGAARRPAPGAPASEDTTLPAPAAPSAPQQPQRPEPRVGHGWVDFGDGRVWLDTNSGAGTWTRGHYDEAQGRIVFTGRSPFTRW